MDKYVIVFKNVKTDVVVELVPLSYSNAIGIVEQIIKDGQENCTLISFTPVKND